MAKLIFFQLSSVYFAWLANARNKIELSICESGKEVTSIKKESGMSEAMEEDSKKEEEGEGKPSMPQNWFRFNGLNREDAPAKHDAVPAAVEAWLPDGYSQIFRIVCVWPFGLLDYGSTMLRCKI